MQESGNAYFLALSESNWKEIEVERPIQVAISKKHLNVNFKEPFVGYLAISCFK